MKSRSNRRAVRQSGFESRALHDPSVVSDAAELGRFVAVNPLSDETDLLRRLRMSAKECIKVDCYWNINNEVHFVQVQTSGCAAAREPGVYARRVDNEAYLINFVAVVRNRWVSRAVVLEALRRARDVLLMKPKLGGCLKLCAEENPATRRLCVLGADVERVRAGCGRSFADAFLK